MCKRVIGYTRVSTEQQADSGLGLEAQAAAIRAYAAQHGAEVVGIYADAGVSGSTGLDARPQLLIALSMLKRGDGLVVAKRDRLARDPMVSAMVEAAAKKSGAVVRSCAGEGTEDDTPTGQLMRRIVDAFSEYERLMIGVRIRAAHRAKKARGEMTGTVPYGWTLRDPRKQRVPGTRRYKHLCTELVEVAQEHDGLKLARMLRAQGRSLRAIGVDLANAGYLPKSGKSWSAQGVCYILGEVR